MLGRTGAPAWMLSHGIASVTAIAILTYFHIVIGEMVPKSLALSQAERMVLWITPPMLWIKTLVFPLIVALNGTGNAVLRLLGVNRRAQNADQYYTSEELQMIVQESEELGAIRSESGQMLQELFEFGDLTAAEAMVPRVRITGVPVGSTCCGCCCAARPSALVTRGRFRSCRKRRPSMPCSRRCGKSDRRWRW